MAEDEVDIQDVVDILNTRDKIDIEVLIDTVQRWRNFGYTEEETGRFYDAVATNLSHLTGR